MSRFRWCFYGVADANIVVSIGMMPAFLAGALTRAGRKTDCRLKA